MAVAESLGRPVKYLASRQVSEERIARGIAAKEGIPGGLVCVPTCVEPARTACAGSLARQNHQAYTHRAA